jgi:hypothetical protein
MADVKGDLTGISQRRQAPSEKLLAVLKDRGLEAPAPLQLPDHAVGRVRQERVTRCAPPSATWGRCC